MSNADELLAAATQLHNLGAHLVPIGLDKDGGKTPLAKFIHGPINYYEVQPDLEQINQWIKSLGSRLVGWGILSSKPLNNVTLDIEPASMGSDLMQAIVAELRRKYPDSVVSSVHGGIHVYFIVVGSVDRLPNKVSGVWVEVDGKRTKELWAEIRGPKFYAVPVGPNRPALSPEFKFAEITSEDLAALVLKLRHAVLPTGQAAHYADEKAATVRAAPRKRSGDTPDALAALVKAGTLLPEVHLLPDGYSRSEPFLDSDGRRHYVRPGSGKGRSGNWHPKKGNGYVNFSATEDFFVIGKTMSWAETFTRGRFIDREETYSKALLHEAMLYIEAAAKDFEEAGISPVSGPLAYWPDEALSYIHSERLKEVERNYQAQKEKPLEKTPENGYHDGNDYRGKWVRTNKDQMERRRFAWQDKIVRYGAYTITGKPKVGKTTVAAWLTSQFAKNAFEGKGDLAGPMLTGIVGAEDGFRDTWAPMLAAYDIDPYTVPRFSPALGPNGRLLGKGFDLDTWADDLINGALDEGLGHLLIESPDSKLGRGRSSDKATDVDLVIGNLRDKALEAELLVGMLCHASSKDTKTNDVRTNLDALLMGSTKWISVARSNLMILDKYVQNAKGIWVPAKSERYLVSLGSNHVTSDKAEYFKIRSADKPVGKDWRDGSDIIPPIIEFDPKLDQDSKVDALNDSGKNNQRREVISLHRSADANLSERDKNKQALTKEIRSIFADLEDDDWTITDEKLIQQLHMEWYSKKKNLIEYWKVQNPLPEDPDKKKQYKQDKIKQFLKAFAPGPPVFEIVHGSSPRTLRATQGFIDAKPLRESAEDNQQTEETPYGF